MCPKCRSWSISERLCCGGRFQAFSTQLQEKNISKSPAGKNKQITKTTTFFDFENEEAEQS